MRRGLSEFVASLSAAARGQEAITLAYPHLEYRGSVADMDYAIMHWLVDIDMLIDSDADADENTMGMGFLELWTAPVDGRIIEALDAISADTAEYLSLFSNGRISDEVAEQFDELVVTGLLILNKAYIHPAARGHDLGAWAVAQAIRHLTFGSAGVLVVAYPTPTEKRAGVSTSQAAKRLARHWCKVGFETIKSSRKLMGQTTSGDALEDAYDALSAVGQLEITVAVTDSSHQGEHGRESETV
jgi:hypothetical protein